LAHSSARQPAGTVIVWPATETSVRATSETEEGEEVSSPVGPVAGAELEAGAVLISVTDPDPLVADTVLARWCWPPQPAGAITAAAASSAADQRVRVDAIGRTPAHSDRRRTRSAQPRHGEPTRASIAAFAEGGFLES
jgi:hypothetical protein